jgi:hypothetical protein
MQDHSAAAPTVIGPVKVKNLPAFLAAVEPIARDLAAGDILAALARHADALVTATAIGAGVERSWLEQQDADVLVDLAARVVEVNADFFVRRVLPAIAQAAERLAAMPAATASGGTSGSPDWSQPDSPTPM